MVTRRRKNLLRRKLFRDIRGNAKSFAAVFIICMLSVTLYLGINAAWRGMEINLDYQFEECNLSDIWISGELSDRMILRIGEIEGVSGVQRRLSVRANVKDMAEDPRLDLYMAEDQARINRPLMLEGENVSAESGKNLCVVNAEFLSAHGIAIGDSITVEVGGERLELKVAGSCYSSEYVIFTDSYSFATSDKTFGYAYVSPATLAFLPYDEAVVTLSEGADLAAVKSAIEALIDDNTVILLTRNDKLGIKMAIEEVEQVRALGTMFPAVFFLVAALITWSTMKRLVDNQRQQLGTLLSLGYSQSELVRHYVSYGLIVSAAGSLVGILGARFFVGEVVKEILMTIYVMPGVYAYIDPLTAVGTCALTILIATGASFISCRRSFKDMPASLLRPKPPAHGRRVFLEYIRPLWRRLSFSSKMIVRNMFRNLSRFFIGIVGITGCVALLLTGFGMRDSVNYILENHYGNTMRYDAKASLSGVLPDDYLNTLRMRSGADYMEPIMEYSCELNIGGEWWAKGLTVLSDRHDMVYIESGEDGERLYLPETGAVITEKTASETGLGVGDSVELKAPNGRTATVAIENVISMQLGQGIYMSRTAWRKLDIMPFIPTGLMLAGENIDITAIEDMDGVDNVRMASSEREDNATMLGVMDVIVVIMALFAGALALVVLFTLGQLNFFERQRELATLMVLGFYPRENKKIILRENIVIAVIGIPIGLIFGPYLHSWVLESGLPNVFEFIPYIKTSSWILTALFTLVFARVVNIFLGFKFKKVKMVESLKSVE